MLIEFCIETQKSPKTAKEKYLGYEKLYNINETVPFSRLQEMEAIKCFFPLLC